MYPHIVLGDLGHLETILHHMETQSPSLLG